MRRTGFFLNERCFWHSGGNYARLVPVGGPVQPMVAGGLPEAPESKRRLRNLLEVSGLLDALEPGSAGPLLSLRHRRGGRSRRGGGGAGYNVNIPLEPGAGHAAYLAAMDRIVLPRLAALRADVVIAPAVSTPRTSIRCRACSAPPPPSGR